MEDVKIVGLDDTEGIREVLEVVIGQTYKGLVTTDDPVDVLISRYDCAILDYDIGLKITGHDVACKLRRMYGDDIYLISNSSALPTEVDQSVYNNIVMKGQGFGNLFMALGEFERWYSARQ